MKQVVKYTLALLLFYSGASWALSEFTVEKIKLQGLSGIAESTVYNYLPVKEGELLTEQKASTIIRTLFKQGFFNDVSLLRDGNTLIVNLVERPSISNIKIEGNEEISEEDLTNALKSINLSVGRIFNRSLLDKVQQEVKRQYFALGRYGVKITSNVIEQERNRVAIEINIDEGQVTRIRKINLIGNNAYPDDELFEVFQSGAHSDWSVFTSDSQYSKQKLFADIELLRSYYMDRGYVKFKIVDTNVSITPDKSDVFITINVDEGGRYSIDKVKLSGEFVVPEEELKKFLRTKSGDTFSRRQISETTKAITDRLGIDGYAFANVNAHPEINDEDKTVSLTFFLDPGKRVYIRRVAFGGNVKTHDDVLRREMRQLEGGWFSTAKLERSKTRLIRTGFFEDVNIETPLVAGKTDMVDVVINVTERPSGSVQASVGYGQGSGVILSGSVNQNNFLGTGKRVGLEVSNNDVNRVYSFSMTDPYYTIDGISRSFRLYFRETDADQAVSIAGYSADEYGGSLSFGFPLSEYRSARVGFQLDNTVFKLDSSPPTLYKSFEDKYGNNFDTLTLLGSWSYDTRDRIIFPEYGLYTIISADVTSPGGDLQFFKTSLRQQLYWTIFRKWTLHLDGTIAYADGYGDTPEVPFYEHYYAGGAQSVRGFRANSLGPRDEVIGDTIGGNKKAIGVAEILFPNPFDAESKSVRFSAFIDSGWIWGYREPLDISNSEGIKDAIRDLRAAYGFGFTWMAPIGALKFSWAWALRSQRGDETERFQFSIGAPF